ncbi:hypothetical protein N7513_013362 [Penicillium frequentans]|nr:hypothetical protein N7513_013362 [Penicillium glabrum]
MALTDPDSIGFIGLGAMGMWMADHLAEKLPPTTHLFIYDIITPLMNELYAKYPQKVVRCVSPKDVADQSVIILTMLPEGKDVKTVYLSAEGICSAELKEKLLIDCSTIDTASFLEIRDHVTNLSPSTLFYDAPVSGGVIGAKSGTLAFFLGCREDESLELRQVTGLLSLMGSTVIPCGGPSLGLAAKLSNNYLSGIIAIACSEAMDMGMRSGLDPRTLAKVYAAGTAQNTVCDRFCPVPGVYPEAPSSNGYRDGFKIQLMRKDFSLAVEMARRVEARNVLGGAGLTIYEGASEDVRFASFSIAEYFKLPTKMSTDPKFDDLHKGLFEEGLKVRRAVVGEAYVDKALENGSTEFSRAGQEHITEWAWGNVWTRPGLERRDRSLLNIGMLMALNRGPELAVHIRGARNNGLSELEIREAIIHATVYCGAPAGVDAMKIAERVLNEMAEKGEMPRQLGSRVEN